MSIPEIEKLEFENIHVFFFRKFLTQIIIDDEKKLIRFKDFKDNVFKLSYGKKKHYLIKII